MVLLQPVPEPNGGRATIREVYAIVSKLEDKLVDEIRLSETRITGAVADIRRLRADDMARVLALEEWRRNQEQSRAVSTAIRSGRWWFFRESGAFIESHWRSIVAVIAAAILVIGKVNVQF